MGPLLTVGASGVEADSVPFLTFLSAKTGGTEAMWPDSAMPRRVALSRGPAAVSMQASVTVTLWGPHIAFRFNLPSSQGIAITQIVVDHNPTEEKLKALGLSSWSIWEKEVSKGSVEVPARLLDDRKCLPARRRHPRDAAGR